MGVDVAVDVLVGAGVVELGGVLLGAAVGMGICPVPQPERVIQAIKNVTRFRFCLFGMKFPVVFNLNSEPCYWLCYFTKIVPFYLRTAPLICCISPFGRRVEKEIALTNPALRKSSGFPSSLAKSIFSVNFF